jgi:hypothetical protein
MNAGTHSFAINLIADKKGNMKKSIGLLGLGLGIVIGVTVAELPPHQLLAQPVAAVPDDVPGSLMVLQGQSVQVGLRSGGAIPGKVMSSKDGWITLDAGAALKDQPICRIPIHAVTYIYSAK